MIKKTKKRPNPEKRLAHKQSGDESSFQPILADTSSRAQRLRIAAHLQAHGSITTIQARSIYGIMSPAPRVQELRRQGWNIRTQRIAAIDSLGVKHSGVGHYLLIGSGRNE